MFGFPCAGCGRTKNIGALRFARCGSPSRGYAAQPVPSSSKLRLVKSRLAEISWLRGVRNRKLLICRTRNKKVSTTFLISCLVGLRGLAPEIGGCAAVVEAADPSPASPRPDDVLLRVVCSGASPIGARRPVVHVRRASECLKEFPTRLGASAPARVLPTA